MRVRRTPLFYFFFSLPVKDLLLFSLVVENCFLGATGYAFFPYTSTLLYKLSLEFK